MGAGPQKGNYIVVFQPSIFRCKLAVSYILMVYFPEKEKNPLENRRRADRSRGSQAPPLASVASLPPYQPPGGMAVSCGNSAQALAIKNFPPGFTNMDTQNDAIFERRYMLKKPSCLVSMLDFGGGGLSCGISSRGTMLLGKWWCPFPYEPCCWLSEWILLTFLLRIRSLTTPPEDVRAVPLWPLPLHSPGAVGKAEIWSRWTSWWLNQPSWKY